MLDVVTTVTSLHGRSMAAVVDRLAAVPGREGRLTHLERLPARPGRTAPWPDWADALGRRGLPEPRHRPAVAAPGGRRRRGVRRAARRAVDRHGVRQVDGLPAARADRRARGPRGAGRARRHHSLSRADQGPGPGPAGRAHRAGPRRPDHHPRRRQRARPARVGSRPRRIHPHQPRHAPPLPAPGPRTLALLPLPALLRRHRRVPPLPRRLRGPRRPGAAPAAPDLRGVRRAAHVRAGLGDGRRARGGRGPAHRPRRPGGDRRRLTARRGLDRAVAALAHPVHGRERRPAAPGRVVRGGRPAGRPGRRGRPHPGLHPVAPGRRAGRDDRRRAARGGRPVAAGAGRGLPRRLPPRGAPRARATAARRRADRAGGHQRARARHRRERPRRRAPGRLPGHPGGVLAAGRPGRPRRRRRPRRAGGPRRPARHLPRHPPGGAARPAGRGDRLRPLEPLRARPAPVRGRRRDPADRGRAAAAVRPDRTRRRRPADPGRAAPASARAAGSGPTGAGPATWPTSAPPAGRRCSWWRPAPAG